MLTDQAHFLSFCPRKQHCILIIEGPNCYEVPWGWRRGGQRGPAPQLSVCHPTAASVPAALMPCRDCHCLTLWVASGDGFCVTSSLPVHSSHLVSLESLSLLDRGHPLLTTVFDYPIYLTQPSLPFGLSAPVMTSMSSEANSQDRRGSTASHLQICSWEGC